MEKLEKLDFLLERTPHGVIEILLKNLQNDEIQCGVPPLNDFLIENFEDDITFLKAFVELEYCNLTNLMTCFKNEDNNE